MASIKNIGGQMMQILNRTLILNIEKILLKFIDCICFLHNITYRTKMKKPERKVLKLKDLKKNINLGHEERLTDRIVYERLQSRE